MIFDLFSSTNASRHNATYCRCFRRTCGQEIYAQRWFKKFESKNTNLDNEERGRPNTVIDEEELQQLVDDNPRATFPEFAQELCVTTYWNTFGAFESDQQVERAKEFDKWIPQIEQKFKKKNAGT